MGFDFIDSGSADGADERAAILARSADVLESVNSKHEAGAVASRLDFDAAKVLIAGFDAQIEQAEREAAAFTVDSDDSAREATDRAGEALGFIKRLEARRKEIIDAPDSFVRKLNQFVKPRRDRVEDVARLYKRRIGDYQHKKELERRAIAKAQEDERRKFQAQLDAEADRLKVERVEAPPVAVPRSSGPTRAESATASTRMVTIAEVIDLSAVPRNYIEAVFRKTINIDGDADLDATTEAIWSRLGAAIMEAHKAGLTDIPGVRFSEKAVVGIRRVG